MVHEDSKLENLLPLEQLNDLLMTICLHNLDIK